MADTNFSHVWVVRDVVRGREGIIKIGLGGAGESIMREWGILFGNIHPSFPRLYDDGKLGPDEYIVMEYIAGVTLRDEIDKPEKIPLWRAIKIVMDTLGGLNALHQNKLIHRDIKPENIMITPTGEARLIDFGIAAIR